MTAVLALAPSDDHGIAGGHVAGALRQGSTTAADFGAPAAPTPRRARKAWAPRKADLETLGRLVRLGTSLDRRAGQAVKIGPA